MWKNVVDADRPHMAMQCLNFKCWISKATDTHSEY